MKYTLNIEKYINIELAFASIPADTSILVTKIPDYDNEDSAADLMKIPTLLAEKNIMSLELYTKIDSSDRAADHLMEILANIQVTSLKLSSFSYIEESTWVKIYNVIATTQVTSLDLTGDITAKYHLTPIIATLGKSNVTSLTLPSLFHIENPDLVHLFDCIGNTPVRSLSFSLPQRKNQVLRTKLTQCCFLLPNNIQTITVGEVEICGNNLKIARFEGEIFNEIDKEIVRLSAQKKNSSSLLVKFGLIQASDCAIKALRELKLIFIKMEQIYGLDKEAYFDLNTVANDFGLKTLAEDFKPWKENNAFLLKEQRNKISLFHSTRTKTEIAVEDTIAPLIENIVALVDSPLSESYEPRRMVSAREREFKQGSAC